MFPGASRTILDSILQLYMSPLTQIDFESWSKLKLRLKVEKIIKEYVSLNLLLSTIFTGF
jgi:hypothetical protein